MADKETMIERVARAIADEIGPSYDDAYENKQAWLRDRGARGDVNGPFKIDYREAARAAITAMREPTTEMKRGLIRHRGYDPDAKEETLDKLGQLDLATMGTHISSYQAMIDAALDEAS